MSDKLTNRLRGKYSVGPDGVYGTRDFSSFIPPICLEAADRIEELENALLDARSGMNYIRDTYGDLYGVGFDRVEDKAAKALVNK
jgi:hypothetical protein